MAVDVEVRVGVVVRVSVGVAVGLLVAVAVGLTVAAVTDTTDDSATIARQPIDARISNVRNPVRRDRTNQAAIFCDSGLTSPHPTYPLTMGVSQVLVWIEPTANVR